MNTMNIHGVTSVKISEPRHLNGNLDFCIRTLLMRSRDDSEFEVTLFAERPEQLVDITQDAPLAQAYSDGREGQRKENERLRCLCRHVLGIIDSTYPEHSSFRDSSADVVDALCAIEDQLRDATGIAAPRTPFLVGVSA